MKKRLLLFFIAGFSLFTLTGCMIASTGLEEEEMEQVAEYTAKLLLKHVRGYEPHLLENIEVEDNPSLVKEEFGVLGEGEKKETMEEKPSEEKIPMEEMEEKPSEEKAMTEEKEEDEKPLDKKDEKKLAGKLSDIYSASGFDVVYGGSGEFNKFPKNEGYFSLVPPEGMKLFVVTLIIRNTGTETKRFTHNKDIRYSLDFYKTGKLYRPSVTLLERDMKFLDIDVEKGESVSGVVVFNVPSAVKMKDVNFVISGNGQNYELSVSR